MPTLMEATTREMTLSRVAILYRPYDGPAFKRSRLMDMTTGSALRYPLIFETVSDFIKIAADNEMTNPLMFSKMRGMPEIISARILRYRTVPTQISASSSDSARSSYRGLARDDAADRFAGREADQLLVQQDLGSS